MTEELKKDQETTEEVIDQPAEQEEKKESANKPEAGNEQETKKREAMRIQIKPKKGNLKRET